MKLREFISKLEKLAQQWPELAVVVAGNDGPSHWLGPPNLFYLDDLRAPTEVTIEYEPNLGDDDD